MANDKTTRIRLPGFPTSIIFGPTDKTIAFEMQRLLTLGKPEQMTFTIEGGIIGHELTPELLGAIPEGNADWFKVHCASFEISGSELMKGEKELPWLLKGRVVWPDSTLGWTIVLRYDLDLQRGLMTPRSKNKHLPNPPGLYDRGGFCFNLNTR